MYVYIVRFYVYVKKKLLLHDPNLIFSLFPTPDLVQLYFILFYFILLSYHAYKGHEGTTKKFVASWVALGEYVHVSIRLNVSEP